MGHTRVFLVLILRLRLEEKCCEDRFASCCASLVITNPEHQLYCTLLLFSLRLHRRLCFVCVYTHEDGQMLV